MFANGWYQIALSSKLMCGELKSLRYFSQELVLYRGEDQQVRVFDAYCPHLGAHLGKGGEVVGNSIRCPFHGWKFCGEGQCEEIPYSKRIPPKAKLKAYPVSEVNGIIFLYYHSDNRLPDVSIPSSPEYSSDEWTEYKILNWQFNSNVEYVIENIADISHFRYVHGTESLPNWEWDILPDCFRLQLTTRAKLLGKYFDTTIDARIVSPGHIITRVKQTLDIIINTSVTPIDGARVKVCFAVAFKKNVNPLLRLLLTPFFMAEIRKQFENDIAIFENRKSPKRPLFCDGDGTIVQYRKWYAQFYSDSIVPDMKNIVSI